ncbi:MAG: carboxypeptidase-like regulatory domain-containing protein [Muribaculaceae bacterium]|nr:carboxypeptidase-like regulatory domain-containing protein [Muribaculaceae bacterium]
MKPSKIIFLFFFVFFSTINTVTAQNQLTLTGTVKDKNGDVLPGVMVVIKNNENAPLSYTTTNNDGHFSLSCPQNSKNGTINFSYIGFKSLSLPIEKFKSGSAVIMAEQSYQLKEVTVKLPEIRSSGDTITYNVASFKSATDRTIEDIIKKLPGINVNDQGIIYYNGEAINKFYIEGLDMLTGRYALATKNISPDDVASINVYENHQPKKVLKDVEFSEKAALNLKLKKKRMLKPIGFIKGGGGIDNDGDCLWLGEAFGMFISPKNQMLITAKGNAAGISYINETRSLTGDNDISGNKAYGVYPTTPFGNAKIPSERYYDNRSISASINSISKLTENTNLSVSADYADEINSYQNSRDVVYSINDVEGRLVSEKVINRPHSREAKVKMRFENNATSHYFSDQLSFVGHFDSNRYNITDGDAIKQTVSTNDYNFNNKFDGTIRIAKHLVSFTSIIGASLTPFNRLEASENGLLFLNQNVKGLNFMTKETMGYSWMFSNVSSLGLNASFEASYNKLESLTELPVDFSGNDISGYDIETIVTPEYKINIPRGPRLTFSAPLRLKNMEFKNQVINRKYPLNRFDADLKAQLNYTFPFKLKTGLTFGRQNRIGGMSDFIENPIYTTFMRTTTLGSGKTNLRNSYYTSANFSYRNTIEGLFGSVIMMYRLSKSNRMGELSISQDDQISTAYSNIDNRMNNFNTNISLSKKFYKWHTSFAVDGAIEILGKDVLRQNNILNLNVKTYVAQATINSNPIGNYLIIKLSGKYSDTRSSTGRISPAQSMRDITASLSLSSQPIKIAEIGIHGYFSRTSLTTDIIKNSFFMDCNVNFHFKRFELELTARNLTNEKNYSYGYITDSDRYSFSFDLRPLEAFITLKYNF